MRVTIYDIAKEAGVSVASVSKVLGSGSYQLSKNTRDKILEAAKALQYDKIPNLEPEQMEKQKDMVAVIVPNITNPYYASLITGLENSLKVEGMDMVLYNTHSNKALEQEYTYNLVKEKFKGVIIVSICEENHHIEKLINCGIRVIALEQYVRLECNKVGFNYFAGGQMAVEYLVSKGKKKIAFISSPLTRASRNQVYKGYLSGLKKGNIPFAQEYVRSGKGSISEEDELFDYKCGMEQVQKMLVDGYIPDAIFCINDMMAIGAMAILKKYGYQIPEDVGVIGFDNIYFSQMICPALTTIEQPTYELGTMAAEILMGGIRDPNRNNVTVSLEPKLIIRESV